MTTDDKKRTLISYRMTQAKESLDEARYLLDGDKSLRSVANRIYYSMFYAVLALLVNEPYSSSKHSGVLSYFNRRYIKDSVFPEELGIAINRAFDIRQRGDYKEDIIIEKEQISNLIEKAALFIETVEKYLIGGGWILTPPKSGDAIHNSG